jgi:hypothetical protein
MLPWGSVLIRNYALEASNLRRVLIVLAQHLEQFLYETIMLRFSAV